jgi:predicted DNA-binding ribbon-helix-helix protein
MSRRKGLSTRTELVRDRREIAFRPEKSLFRQVAQISKKRGVSMNQLVTELVKEGIKEEGVNTLARI